MSRNVAFPRNIQYAVEYALVRTLSSAVGILPERAAVAFGRFLGLSYWCIAFFRRRIARTNIEKAMPGRYSPQEVRRLVRSVFFHIGLTAVESLWARRQVNSRNIRDRFPVDNTDVVRKQLSEGRGAIGFTPHLGNWELFGSSMSVHLGRLHALARPVNNPFIEHYMTRLREEMGIHVLSTRDGARPLVAALRANEPLAILIDQHVNRAFVPATFFGRPAATTAVVATFALRMNVPVFMGYSLREGYTFRHHGYVEGPLELIRTGDHEADVLANTQRFNDKLEEIVRTHPEQWLWTHRRWKLAVRLAREPAQEKQADVR